MSEANACKACGREIRANAKWCKLSACQDAARTEKLLRKREEDAAYRARARERTKIDVTSKVCSSCRVDLPASAFHQMSASRDGLQAECRSCNAASTRRHYLHREYGITPEQYDALLEAQGGVCAICSENSPVLAVDHDHSTGEVRGLLCNPCNRGIGLLRDDPDLLVGAAAYVLRSQSVLEVI